MMSSSITFTNAHHTWNWIVATQWFYDFIALLMILCVWPCIHAHLYVYAVHTSSICVLKCTYLCVERTKTDIRCPHCPCPHYILKQGHQLNLDLAIFVV